jgi:hypothetical protein
VSRIAEKKWDFPNRREELPFVEIAIDRAPPTEQQIREAAYRIYEHRMASGVAGDPVDDWLLAQWMLSHVPELMREIEEADVAL